MKTIKFLKIATYFFIFITVLLMVMYLYRFLLAFNAKKVNQYVEEESLKYGSNAKTVENTLQNAIKSIKTDAKLVNSIVTSAKAANMEKERVLVNVAIAQSISNKLILA